MTEATAQTKTFSERADELEHEQIAALDPIPQPSAIYLSGERDPTKPMPPPQRRSPGNISSWGTTSASARCRTNRR